MSDIIKNASSGYGYNYASLSDIVKQGQKLPLMRVRVIDGLQFVQWKDAEGNWQTGAQVPTDFTSKGMNVAQAYGSALTYARRYTALMALQLACEDDKDIENARQSASEPARASKATKTSNQPSEATDAQKRALHALLGNKYDGFIAKNVKGTLTKAKASQLIEAINAKKAEAETAKIADEATAPVTLDEIPF